MQSQMVILSYLPTAGMFSTVTAGSAIAGHLQDSCGNLGKAAALPDVHSMQHAAPYEQHKPPLKNRKLFLHAAG